VSILFNVNKKLFKDNMIQPIKMCSINTKI